MQYCFMRRLLVSLIACFLALSAWAVSPHSAWGFDKPELLPDTQTPVIDLADFIPSVQEESLVEDLESFEAETGWKLRVLTQYYQTPGRAVKEFWGLDDKSILLVADSRGNNLLAFNVGDDIYQLLPRTFWVELQTRYGNLYFVDDNGKNSAIIQSIETIKNCLRESGCSVVPGLPREQWILTLITSVVGGLVLGFAGTPRKEGQTFAWQWALIFSPLWGILFIAFGIGPVVTRTSEWLPLFRNVLGFMFGILVAYLSPILNRSPNSEET
ncbi:MAG: methanol dehydrogenase [Cyanobacteria bacterium QH_9_48_43]|nr:MAG: methanol dehydrogenase [Cyanobacteria bacterium QH_10_48_56]PSO63902.1 MAG: methanol dehydrogenase [Cyanobacteria bacterium QH_7_48_89]PSO64601.1 MAG: methanol dehydrogenase [Cyanobacteria bacterium QH_2_48_84]PSO69260.1 MAG: methanol dehydrogenase [Cyanobacteria bacterium QS_1_48_34]PSO78571.1 MAG: methanol dehydrogenase [Cyanobacteria bacterium QH_3_48_40]PSO86052.1 MAG: methanol dehydrogenase [Cyanobacteria bacterium QH_9_48_43]PSO87509.1 MAG: methanol dehydrogenase [Cyanobacteria 